ncbi:cation transporter [Butyrivibrio sp. YAB3001]|uniref:cation transporter n=1 Tax=Butyrivibrio sp. YAB3001 TaxID=1520812 RepID=UPI0008F6861D|nr:cation transporter [Butyrivibrio sp. YAB3001]SFB96688.1 Divalent metal cation (Fe/Co/Zn/Cd) transporter [Butyrivibrio sp. YAB3001]
MKAEVLEKQQKLALLLLLWRIPGTVAAFIAATASDSMVLWLEFIENFSIVVPGIIILFLSQKLNKNLKFRFNYGTGKVEAIVALCCEVFDIAGLFCIVFFAVRKIIRGSSEEGDLFLALGVSILGVLIDFFIMKKERALFQKEHSRMLHTAYLSAQKEFGFDFISIATIAISIVFAKTSWIRFFSPVVSIIIAMFFGKMVLDYLRGAVIELADMTLDEESQLKIVKVLNEFFDAYETLGDVKSRVNGKNKIIDIGLEFRSDMTFEEVSDIVKRMKERITQELGECSVNIYII